jgi:hypothetical protein
MNGWSKGGATGWCRFEPKAIEKEAISFCSHWTKSLKEDEKEDEDTRPSG